MKAGFGLPPVAVAVLALAAWALAPGLAQAALYKWVDDKGVIHYTDHVPPEAVNKGNVQLNPQGIAIKKVPPAVTPEQRKALEAELEQQRELAKEQAEAARRDRALLDSYTTESDIDLAKNRSIRTIEAALQSAQAYSAQLTKRRSDLMKTKAEYAGKPVPANIERELAATEAELGRQLELIERKKNDLVTIAARYDHDKQRWQALRGTTASPPALPASAAAAPQGAAKK